MRIKIKIKREINLSLKLHTAFTALTKKSFSRAKLFLIAKDANDTYVDAVLLKNTEGYGCGYNPGANTTSLTKGCLSLMNKGLTPDAFVLVNPYFSKTDWGGVFGEAIYSFRRKKVVFISFGRRFIKAEDRNGEYEIKIVKTDYKKFRAFNIKNTSKSQ